MMNKCESCQHIKVCKYKENYSKLMNEAENWEKRNGLLQTSFSLELNCSNYKIGQNLAATFNSINNLI